MPPAAPCFLREQTIPHCSTEPPIFRETRRSMVAPSPLVLIPPVSERLSADGMNRRVHLLRHPPFERSYVDLCPALLNYCWIHIATIISALYGFPKRETSKRSFHCHLEANGKKQEMRNSSRVPGLPACPAAQSKSGTIEQIEFT